MTAGLVHEALYYDSDAALLAFAVPYLRAGLDSGEFTAFFGDERETALVAGALGGDPRLNLLPLLEPGARPGRTYSRVQELIIRQAAAETPRVRCMGRPNFTGTAAQRQRWHHHESVLNHALAALPVSLVCLYDGRIESPDTLAGGLLTHPQVATAVGRGANPGYRPPTEHLPVVDVPTPAADPAVDLAGVTATAAARRAVTAVVLAGRRPTEEREDFVTAIAELVENALRHGRPPVDVRVWVSGAELVGEVTDRGPGVADRLLGYRPVRPAELRTGPLGLWLVRRLCDDLDYGRDDAGFTVRLRTTLPP